MRDFMVDQLGERGCNRVPKTSRCLKAQGWRGCSEKKCDSRRRLSLAALSKVVKED